MCTVQAILKACSLNVTEEHIIINTSSLCKHFQRIKEVLLITCVHAPLYSYFASIRLFRLLCGRPILLIQTILLLKFQTFAILYYYYYLYRYLAGERALFQPLGVEIELVFALRAAVFKIQTDFQNCHICA